MLEVYPKELTWQNVGEDVIIPNELETGLTVVQTKIREDNAAQTSSVTYHCLRRSSLRLSHPLRFYQQPLLLPL